MYGQVFLPSLEDGLVSFDLSARRARSVDWAQPFDGVLGGAGVHVMDLESDAWPGQSVVGAGRRGELWRWNPTTCRGEVLEAEIPTTPVKIRSLHTGPDGMIDIGLSYNAGTMVRFDPVGDRFVRHRPGTTSQTHSHLNLDGKIYFGTYSKAVLHEYDPAAPYDFGRNPRVVVSLGEQRQDRIFGLAAAGHRVAFGTLGRRGQASGRFGFFDPGTGLVEDHGEILPGHSINALWVHGWTLYGGTSVDTPGAPPVEPAALVFAWDLETDRLLWSETLSDDVATIANIVGSADGGLWLLTTQGTLVEYDPARRRTVRSIDVAPPGGHHGLSSLVLAPDGCVYGAAGSERVFAVDPSDGAVRDLGPGDHITLDRAGTPYVSRNAELGRIAALG